MKEFLSRTVSEKAEVGEPVGFLTDSGEFFILPPSSVLRIPMSELISSINETGDLVYITPPQPQSVKDALEKAADICDKHYRSDWNYDRKAQAKLLRDEIRALITKESE